MEAEKHRLQADQRGSLFTMDVTVVVLEGTLGGSWDMKAERVCE